MSYFIAVVILPRDREEFQVGAAYELDEELVASYIEEEMDPFSENADLVEEEEYLEISEVLHEVNQIREHYDDCSLGWKDIPDFTSTSEEFFSDDEGIYRTNSCNPNAEWDYYRIGGRWDGWISGHKVKSEHNGFNFNDKHEQVKYNSAKSRFVLKNKKWPGAFLTPDGQWIGNAGLWSSVESEKHWEAVCHDILTEFDNHWVVAVDCHI